MAGVRVRLKVIPKLWKGRLMRCARDSRAMKQSMRSDHRLSQPQLLIG